jgi:hypothetical protein
MRSGFSGPDHPDRLELFDDIRNALAGHGDAENADDQQYQQHRRGSGLGPLN